MQVIERKENFSGSRLWVSATGSAFMDGFVLTSQGFIFLLAQSVFQFTALELGLVATAYVLGSFIGSMGFGKIADVYGRAVLFRTVPWFVAVLSIAQFMSFGSLSWFISRFCLAWRLEVTPRLHKLCCLRTLPKYFVLNALCF